MSSVSGSLVSGNGINVANQNNAPSFVTRNGQRTDASMQRSAGHVAESLPLLLTPTDNMEERVSLLPNPEDLPPMKEANDTVNATVLLCLRRVSLIVIVVMSHMLAGSRDAINRVPTGWLSLLTSHYEVHKAI